jgi:branched-chain amino acid aminotransferase
MAGPAPESFVPDPNLKIWLNGELVSPAQARVGVFDHGLLYGDGVFEGIRSYNGRVFERITHLKRLEESARAIRLKIPYGTADLSAAIDQTLEANGLLKPGVDAYIRPVVTRGNGALGISPMKTERPQVVIIAASLQMYPPEMYERGMPTIISSVTRNHSNAMPPRIKSLNYLNNILAKLEAIDAGVGEAIMLNAQGCVAEATGDNIFIVRNGQLQTPPTSAGILEGITRNTVIRLAREAGIEVVEKDLERLDLYVADECFLTGTGAEIIPVTSIDKRPIGSGEVGPIARQMITTYRELVRSATDARP